MHAAVALAPSGIDWIFSLWQRPNTRLNVPFSEMSPCRPVLCSTSLLHKNSPMITGTKATRRCTSLVFTALRRRIQNSPITAADSRICGRKHIASAQHRPIPTASA